MLPKAEGGADDIANAIPLCFECHAEVHSYNDKHPRGRKFRPDELKLHKEQWLAVCQTNPTGLSTLPTDVGVGPLQALIDEVDFNLAVARRCHAPQIGCPLSDEQFRRAMRAGAISMLRDSVRDSINAVYADVGRANHFLAASQHHPPGSHGYAMAVTEAQRAIQGLDVELLAAKTLLLEAVSGER